MLKRFRQMGSILLCAALVRGTSVPVGAPAFAAPLDSLRVPCLVLFTTQALAERNASSRLAPGPLSLGRRMHPIGHVDPNSTHFEVKKSGESRRAAKLAARVWKLIHRTDISRLQWHKAELGAIDILKGPKPLARAELARTRGVSVSAQGMQLIAIETYLLAYRRAMKKFDREKVWTTPIMLMSEFDRSLQDLLIRRGIYNRFDLPQLKDPAKRAGLGRATLGIIEGLIAEMEGLPAPVIKKRIRKSKTKDISPAKETRPPIHSAEADVFAAETNLARQVTRLLPEVPIDRKLNWTPAEKSMIDLINRSRKRLAALWRIIQAMPEDLERLQGIVQRLHRERRRTLDQAG